ncbi:hypothetical protein PAPYR_7041 [Paratrimastix pyriformis]|uniref:Uncharacterized protein n=1 Tax=Paratrimastix pyriformis TaxID=342808 RepID=A0ABQ8UDW2_9EUKA|nr:hypothetical protein PAPYR_7041 [Paratrimastix pyriformis]
MFLEKEFARLRVLSHSSASSLLGSALVPEDTAALRQRWGRLSHLVSSLGREVSTLPEGSSTRSEWGALSTLLAREAPSMMRASHFHSRGSAPRPAPPLTPELAGIPALTGVTTTSSPTSPLRLNASNPPTLLSTSPGDATSRRDYAARQRQLEAMEDELELLIKMRALPRTPPTPSNAAATSARTTGGSPGATTVLNTAAAASALWGGAPIPGSPRGPNRGSPRTPDHHQGSPSKGAAPGTPKGSPATHSHAGSPASSASPRPAPPTFSPPTPSGSSPWRRDPYSGERTGPPDTTPTAPPAQPHHPRGGGAATGSSREPPKARPARVAPPAAPPKVARRRPPATATARAEPTPSKPHPAPVATAAAAQAASLPPGAVRHPRPFTVFTRHPDPKPRPRLSTASLAAHPSPASDPAAPGATLRLSSASQQRHQHAFTPRGPLDPFPDLPAPPVEDGAASGLMSTADEDDAAADSWPDLSILSAPRRHHRHHHHHHHHDRPHATSSRSHHHGTASPESIAEGAGGCGGEDPEALLHPTKGRRLAGRPRAALDPRSPGRFERHHSHHPRRRRPTDRVNPFADAAYAPELPTPMLLPVPASLCVLGPDAAPASPFSLPTGPTPAGIATPGGEAGPLAWGPLPPAFELATPTHPSLSPGGSPPEDAFVTPPPAPLPHIPTTLSPMPSTDAGPAASSSLASSHPAPPHPPDSTAASSPAAPPGAPPPGVVARDPAARARLQTLVELEQQQAALQRELNKKQEALRLMLEMIRIQEQRAERIDEDIARRKDALARTATTPPLYSSPSRNVSPVTAPAATPAAAMTIPSSHHPHSFPSK